MVAKLEELGDGEVTYLAGHGSCSDLFFAFVRDEASRLGEEFEAYKKTVVPNIDGHMYTLQYGFFFKVRPPTDGAHDPPPTSPPAPPCRAMQSLAD